MKKILMMAVVAFGMLATACSKDEVAQPVGGEESVVTFTVEAPVMATRAYGEGLVATELNWAVYDQQGNYLFGGKDLDGYKKPLVDKKATVKIPFVNGMAYNILFWAEAPGTKSPYAVDWDAKTVTYADGTKLANDENYDAFFCYYPVPVVTGPVTETVELKRPFAQLRIATNDTAAAALSGISVTATKVTVAKTYTAFDFEDGDVTGTTSTVEFAYNVNAMKAAGQIVVGGNTYDLLTVNYLFGYKGDKKLVDAKLTYQYGSNEVSADFSSVPIQQNYRTNIIGSLLTSEGNFNIVVTPGFEGEPGHKYEVVSVANAQELQDAVNNGAGEIILEDDIVLDGPIVFGTFTRAEVAETNVRPFILDGNGQTLTYNGSDRVINVLTADINLTIKNLTICTASYCNRGINYATNGNLTLENVIINGENITYALNLPDPSDNATVVINNSKITGVIALNVWGENVKMDVTNSEITSVDKADHENYAAIKLNNNGTTSAEGSVINVEGGKVTALDENGEPSAAVTNSTMTGEINISDSTEVIGKIEKRVAMVYWEGQNEFYSYASLEDALERVVELNGDGVRLLEDVEASEIMVLNGSFVFDGNGQTLTSTAQRAINVSGADGVTIKNLTIECSGERAINIIQNATNVKIENVTATAANYTVNVAGSAPNAVVDIKDSTLNGLCTVNVAAAGAEVTVDGCVVNCNDNNTTDGEAYAAISLNKDAVDGTITVTNSEINVAEGSDSVIARNGAPNGTVTIDGSTEGVIVMVAVITFEGSDYYYSFKTLEEAVEYAKEGDVITLIRDIKLSKNITVTNSLIVAEGVEVTLDLNGKTLEGTMHKNVGAVVKNMGTLTVKNGTISSTAENGGSAIQNNAGAELTINDVTINGAEFEAPGWPSYGINNYGEMTVYDVTVNSYHGAIATGGDGVTVIENATVDVGQSTETDQTSWALYVYDNGQLTVNGGTFANTKDEKGEVYGGGYICTLSTNQTIINGGTFDKTEGNNNGSGFYYNCKNLVIKGGTFDVNPPSAYVADGYKVNDNGNGTWSVVAE